MNDFPDVPVRRSPRVENLMKTDTVVEALKDKRFNASYLSAIFEAMPPVNEVIPMYQEIYKQALMEVQS